MFEFLTSASRHTIETQIDFFERAIKETKNVPDAYYPERKSPVLGESAPHADDAIVRPSDEAIDKAVKWITLQRTKYSDSKEIMVLCDRWEALFEQYDLKMKIQKKAIEEASAAARAEVKAGVKADVQTEIRAEKKAKEAAEAKEAADEALEFNRKHITAFKARIDGVLRTLSSLDTPDGARGVENANELRAIRTALENVRKYPDSANVIVLQKAILDVTKGAKFTKAKNEGKPDGLFGDITMEALEKAVNVPAPGEAPTAGPVTDAAPEKSRKAEKGAFVLKDGTPVSGNLRFENGKVWIVGKNGQRVEIRAFETTGSKNVEALTENARKLENVADDAFVMLSSLANHATAKKWKDAPAFAHRVSELEKFLKSLDVSNADVARGKIVRFVHDTLGDGDLRKEFQEVFNIEDGDEARRNKVYDYVRGSLMPNRRNAGFDGASEMLSKKLAARELAKESVSSADLSEFVNRLLDTDWRSKSSAEIAKSVMTNVGQSGLLGLLAKTFDEKAVASFVEDVRETDAELKKAYESKEADAIYASAKKPDGSPLTQTEIATLKVESRKAKLVEFVSTKALVGHVKKNPMLRDKNPGLDTFADIEGVGMFDMSDKAKKYVRNDLWKDISIEVAAIGLGALTAGAGAAGIHALAAARWGNRAREMMGVRLVAGTVGGGAGFELGHGAVRTGVESYKNGELTSAYSWESLAQSMVFGGAFSLAGEALAKAGIFLNPAKRLSEQKAVLATLVGADVTTALGVSYGISVWTGEKWTAEEALQAALMAAAFRAAVSSQARFRAERDPRTGAVNLTPEAPIAPAPAPAPADARRIAADSIRWSRKEIANLRERIRHNEELLQNPSLDEAAKRSLRTDNAEYRAGIERLQSRIASDSASAPAKAPAGEPAPTRTPEAIVAEGVPPISDSRFESFANAVVGNLKKTGDKYSVEGVSITKGERMYELKIGEKTFSVETREGVANRLAQEISTPASRLDFLSKFGHEKLIAKLAKLDKALLENGEYRLSYENGKFGFEKRVAQGEWTKVPTEQVPESVQKGAGELVFGKKEFAKAESALNRLSKKPEDYVSPGEKKAFVSRFGEVAWIKAVKNFEAKLAGAGGDHGHGGHGEGGRHGILGFFFGSHGGSWKSSIAWGLGLQVPGVVKDTLNGKQGDWLAGIEKLSAKDAAEALAETLLFRYVSAGRALIYTGAYAFGSAVASYQKK